MRIKSLRQIRQLKNRPVLLRANFDVPVKFSAGGKKPTITDDYKITTVLPTLRYLSRYRAKVIILSHWGRPKRPEPAYSLKPIARHLSKLLGQPVVFCPQTVGTEAQQAVKNLRAGQILLLENTRFYPGEIANSRYFARRLAELAKISGRGIYLNDAFSVSHRRQASVAAVKDFLPAYAGLLLEKEVKNLAKLKKPARPAVALLGGAKISTKLKVIKKLSRHFSHILVGGAMANNILAARGVAVGRSLVDMAEIDLAQRLPQGKIHLPQDAVVSRRADGQGKAKIKKISDISPKEMILDIGPATILAYAQILKQAKTIVWNGPLGKFEQAPFRHGTVALARLIASRASRAAFAVVGGGDTVAALRLAKAAEYIDWVSTGGGAMLAFLGGEPMPGLKGIVFA